LRDERLTDPVDKRQCLDLLNQEVGRLEGLVERLLQLSRIETGKHDFDRDPVPIDDIVSDALTAFDVATLTSTADLKFTVDVEPGLVVTGDRAALAQTMINLLTNAWKYTPDDDKRIQLSARASSDRWVEIKVSDNGPGIPKGEQKQIFDEFERGKAAIDSRKSGVGLGLATVRAIVRAHKGRVEVSSRLGQGSEFRIILRRGKAHHHAATPIASAAHTPS
jgi:signal transduction histidine kinase